MEKGTASQQRCKDTERTSTQFKSLHFQVENELYPGILILTGMTPESILEHDPQMEEGIEDS